jgi:pilus assembly protein Flp/PilA
MAPRLPSLAEEFPMLRLAHKLLTDERGATAIEYALIASLISVLVFGGSFSIGNTLKNTFTSVAGAL